MGEIDPPARLPLDGVRVLEFGYGIAAPVAARNLAQFGADVIRVESQRRPDSLRMGSAGWLPPEVPTAIRRDTVPALNFSSPEKRSIGLEIDHPDGRAVFERLMAASDVLITNMSGTALEELALTYDDVRALRRDVVYASLPAFGTSGPYRAYKTWGHNLAAVAGVDSLIGWPDRDPVQIGFAYPDFVSAHALTVAVMAALARRGETGEGCRIELSQCAMTLAAIGAEIYAAQARAEAPAANGNRAEGRVPQGLYPTRGSDRWVAISVRDETMWRALCGVPGLEYLGRDPRFTSPDGRAEHHDALDDALAAWTSVRSDWDAATELQAAGVAAMPVFDAYDLVADPQLSARDFFHALPHARFERDLVFGQAVHMSETPPRAEHAAPAFGEDSRDILRDLAGLDNAAIDDLVDRGVVHVMVDQGVAFERPYRHWLAKVQRLVPWGTSTFDPATTMMRGLTEEGGAGRGDPAPSA
jgi:crotonobetainyl-CoA:carnitine CoA-transferase CaiB-like acyl-CoA transferase